MTRLDIGEFEPDARGPVVETDTGAVRGLWRARDGVAYRAFYGIPYAEAPVGDLAFGAPEPARAWSGIRPAHSPGATPLRRSARGSEFIPEPAFPGDSVLNVNVFAPRSPSSQSPLRPVIVWFHGGGFVSGSPSSPWYEGGAFCRDGVVVVAVAYRLGLVGFGVIDGAPMNRGVLDWLLSLDWVRRNIDRFGGDPERVMIAGQSAGAAAVTTLLGLPQAQHLFSTALAMSGGVVEEGLDEAAQFSTAVFGHLGIEPTLKAVQALGRDELHHIDSTVLNEARGVPGDDPLQAVVRRARVIGPVIDGQLLSEPTADSLKAGVGRDKPLMIGSTDGELDPFFAGVDIGDSALATLERLGLTGDRLRRYAEANAEFEHRATSMVGHYVSDRLVRASVAQTAQDRGGAPTWVYRFAWRTPRWDAAVHCVDLPFLFDCLDHPSIPERLGDAPPQSIADAFHGSAVSLAETRRPGWAAWTADRGYGALFDDEVSVVRHAYASVRRFWTSRAPRRRRIGSFRAIRHGSDRCFGTAHVF